MNKFLIDLLPYEQDVKILDNTLKERLLSLVSFMVKEIISSIQDFYFKKQLLSFDPHVGENLCQIRACQILDLHLETQQTPSNILLQSVNLKRFENLLRDVDYLVMTKAYEQTCEDRELTIGKYLANLNLNVSISETLHFLTLSHFLTRYRVFNSQENTLIDYSKLIADLGVSKNLSRRLIHLYQKQLSKHSFEYVKKAAITHTSFPLEMINLLQNTDDDGRMNLPCYIIMETLLADLKAKKLPILFVVRHELMTPKRFSTLVYVYDEAKQQFCYQPNPTDNLLTSFCFVIHGISNRDSNQSVTNYSKQFNEIGLERVIMANMASHPQY